MTTANAILLIVKQNNGIDYNSLLNKFASSYSNINSARAALSRSLKDLTSFGLIARKNNRFFLMDKGSLEIHSELENKLVLSLNELLKQKAPENDADVIVAKLQILIERSKADKDLLKTARSSADFSISDLNALLDSTEKKSSHLKYLCGVLKEQVGSLEKLDFNDSAFMAIKKSSLERVAKLFLSQPDKEFTIETGDEKILSLIAKNFSGKKKAHSVLIEKKFVKEIILLLLENPLEFHVTVFSTGMKAQFYKQGFFLWGPASALRNP